MQRKSARIAVFLAAGAAVQSSLAKAGAFQSPTDLVVLQANVTGQSQNIADSVDLTEYNPTTGFASPVNTINLPTNTLSYDSTYTGQETGLGLTLPDVSDHDGQLTVSQDGHSLEFGTYLATVGQGAPDGYGAPNAAPAVFVPRVISVLYPDGTIDDSTQLSGPDDYASVSLRQVSSLNGTQFWTSGNGDKPYGSSTDIGGLRYTTLGASSTTTLNSNTGIDIRSTAIFEGQLYGDTGSANSPTGEHTLVQLGNGLPNSSPPSWTPLPSPGSDNTNGNGTIYGEQSPKFVTLNNGSIEVYECASGDGDMTKYSLINGQWIVTARTTTFLTG